MKNQETKKTQTNEKTQIKTQIKTQFKTEILKELPKINGELIISQLSKEDLIQLGARYLNDICTYLKNVVLFEAQNAQMIKWLCEKQGIDVNALRRETAEKMREQIDKNIDNAKDKIKSSVN